jgi:hypothetical protein
LEQKKVFAVGEGHVPYGKKLFASFGAAVGVLHAQRLRIASETAIDVPPKMDLILGCSHKRARAQLQ